MASTRQQRAPQRNVRSAIDAPKRKRTISHLPKSTRSALGKQAAAVGSPAGQVR
jgi:hypothetical protein